ncbi:MAG: DUF2007 domain-containing protein [Firmicutes bacterium]|nr:DUF2007 domain-containing protein [Bacillota bacterium]
MAGLVTVLTCANAGEAYLARGALGREGIEAFIFDENMGTLYPPHAVGYVKLKVKEPDLARAKAVLDALAGGKSE